MRIGRAANHAKQGHIVDLSQVILIQAKLLTEPDGQETGAQALLHRYA